MLVPTIKYHSLMEPTPWFVSASWGNPVHDLASFHLRSDGHWYDHSPCWMKTKEEAEALLAKADQTLPSPSCCFKKCSCGLPKWNQTLY